MPSRGSACRYGVILADVPWDYENWTDAVHGAAESAIVTMTTDDIAAIPVASFAEDNAVLAMWATWPKLPDAMRVIEAWGFRYMTGVPWVKTLPPAQAFLFPDANHDPIHVRRGIGFWFQSTSELLLLAVRGKVTPGRTAQIGLLTGDLRQ